LASTVAQFDVIMRRAKRDRFVTRQARYCRLTTWRARVSSVMSLSIIESNCHWSVRSSVTISQWSVTGRSRIHSFIHSFIFVF